MCYDRDLWRVTILRLCFTWVNETDRKEKYDRLFEPYHGDIYIISGERKIILTCKDSLVISEMWLKNEEIHRDGAPAIMSNILVNNKNKPYTVHDEDLFEGEDHSKDHLYLNFYENGKIIGRLIYNIRKFYIYQEHLFNKEDNKLIKTIYTCYGNNRLYLTTKNITYNHKGKQEYESINTRVIGFKNFNKHITDILLY